MPTAGTPKPYLTAAQSIIARLNDAIIFPAITLMIGVAVVVFTWGVFQYVRGEKGAVSHKKGAQLMMWSVIGILVMVSARAILSLAAGAFGISLV